MKKGAASKREPPRLGLELLLIARLALESLAAEMPPREDCGGNDHHHRERWMQKAQDRECCDPDLTRRPE